MVVRAIFAVLLALPILARAAVEVPICYNYGCLSEATVRYDEATLTSIAARLREARTAAQERTALAHVVGWLYREAGRQSPIHADRAGDYLDEGVYGKMDCIDHGTSTTRLLEMLEARGALRFHRVRPQARRTRFVLFQHFSAVVEERVPGDGADATTAGDSPSGARFVIDSWFREHGEPAVVLPLADWLDGDGPNVP
ncbi:MAG: hypothetical protein KDF24_05360 [Rhodocyclaceae bacterium]|nr:hypothetical protein [Rhodocyclaceae bacterium]MCB1962576.1 hypothetical protein [Rhodocyclaceae bacterium]